MSAGTGSTCSWPRLVGASPHEIRVHPPALPDAAGRFAAAGASLFDERYVAPRRTAVSNTSFSTQVCGFDLALLPDLRGYDAVNVHWTGGMMSPLTLGNVIDLGIPTVFTLHDMGHFTGGCHYAAGCRAFEASCEPCHQVHPDELGLIPLSLSRKRERYARPNVVAVSPSAWLAGLADASRVFAAPVRVVQNGLDTEIFRPRDRAAIRRDLGLRPEDRAILFGVYDRVERRKGFDDLAAALDLCARDPAVAALAAEGRIRVLAFGRSPTGLADIGLPVVDLGWVGDDLRLSEVYGAADLCVLPSHEDNQPNVMVEAMACATPVVAYRTGGIPETIADGRNGRLVEPFDRQALAEAITGLVLDPQATRILGREAAASVRHLTLARQAEAYEAILAGLAASPVPRGLDERVDADGGPARGARERGVRGGPSRAAPARSSRRCCSTPLSRQARSDRSSPARSRPSRRRSTSSSPTGR